MRNYTLRTVDKDGNVIAESSLQLKEGSVLIQYVPEGTRSADAVRLHEFMSKTLEADPPLITMIPGVRLQVLEIQ